MHRDGPVHDAALRRYHERSGLVAGRVNAIVLMRITAAEPLVSPAYDDGSSEDQVETRSLALFGLARTRPRR